MVRLSENKRFLGVHLSINRFKQRHDRWRACYFSREFDAGRLRSAEVSQSSGGKLIGQNNGDGSMNSTPTGTFPFSGLPKDTTLPGNSSAVFGLIREICWLRETEALSSTRH